MEATFAYLDDVTICGVDQADHDRNLSRFMAAVRKYGLTLNEDKCSFSQSSVNLLGYTLHNGTIKPDADRLQPLKALRPPTDSKTLKQVMGLFSHYSQWIKNFSSKVQPMVQTTVFPLSEDAHAAFENIREEVLRSVVGAIDEEQPFTVETDASDYAIGATLSQCNRPVAFFSRTLSDSEKRHSSVEKEAYAIVEALRKWRHYLTGKHFTLVTDQQSVAFMFDNKRYGKIKNDKIMRWRLELSDYSYDISYRPGKLNGAADAFSRICGAAAVDGLVSLHNTLCHPGITRMVHFVRSRNLPYSVEEVRSATSACRVCAQVKPRYVRSSSTLIKSTKPFERLNIDFKGPLPSSSRNHYLLTVVDEYSRFPFAFPCSDMTTKTVISCLLQLFSIFGYPSFIHSDCGSSFMTSELKEFLMLRGIATSRTTPYNPRGNGQVERYNGIIWRGVTLALKSQDSPVSCWESVLPDVLHSIRSLLSTATNETPHERVFAYSRKSASGCSLPSWLMSPGRVLLKRHVRNSKYEPLVDEVELLEANPDYAHVRFDNGRETTVSIRDLAPNGTSLNEDHNIISNEPLADLQPTPPIQQATAGDRTTSVDRAPLVNLQSTPPIQQATAGDRTTAVDSNPAGDGIRRSNRVRASPAHLHDYHLEGSKI